ncbi:MAG: hypothetical protein ACLPY5_09395, partial [Candidatus Bathyarchaeia archaeon]
FLTRWLSGALLFADSSDKRSHYFAGQSCSHSKPIRSGLKFETLKPSLNMTYVILATLDG